MTKSDEQLEMQENRKNRVNELVVKLDELVKSDKRWKGCGLPEKYKHFLINYMDSHILGKYEIFANFDQSLDQLIYEQREHHSSIGKHLKAYEPLGESDEYEGEVEVSKKKCRKLIPWMIASNRYYGRVVGRWIRYFIDLNHSSTTSNDVPVYQIYFPSLAEICITKAYSDINDFIIVARLQAKPLKQLRKN